MKDNIQLKYNYVFFNTPDKWTEEKLDGYFSICVEELRGNEQIEVVSAPLYFKNKFFRILWLSHFISILPLKHIWFPWFFKGEFKDREKPICFVCLGSYITIKYIEYLKKKYPDAKFVKLHRDLLKVFQKGSPEWTDEKLGSMFDLWMSIDEMEAEKKGMIHFNEFESRTNVEISKDYPLCDVYFAGLAKDRLPILMDIYKTLTANGLKVEYYLTGVPNEDREVLPGVTYADHSMSYREFLFHTLNARCILEINQEGAYGYTSRFLEAVMYNRRLITNNQSITKSPFYDSGKILCIKKVDTDIVDFVKSSRPVDYGYNNEFSPLYLIQRIDNLLKGGKND